MNRRLLRRSAVLARTELRTRLRRLLGSDRELGNVMVLGVLGLVGVAWAAPRAVTFGAALAGGRPPLGPAGAALTALAGAAAYGAGENALSGDDAGTVAPLVLTALPPRAVAAARIGSDSTGVALAVVAPAVPLLLAVGVGAGGPVAPLLLAVAGVPALLAGLSIGRLAGALARRVDRAVDLSDWFKAVVYVAVSIAAFALTQLVLGSEESGGVAGAVPPLLPGRPIQAYAGVFLAPFGGAVRPLGLLACGLAAVLVPAALAAAVRVEADLVVRDRSDEAPERSATAASSEVPAGLSRTTTGRIAWRYLLRARRDPATLAHLLPVVFGGLVVLSSALSEGDVPYGLWSDVAYVGGVVLAGGAFCLNPLGDDRDQLALLLTSTRSVAALLRGRALAGALLALPLVVLAVPLGLAGRPPAVVLARAALAPVLLVAGTGAALGLGAAVPKFEQSEYAYVERAHPATVPTLGYFFGGVAAAGVGIGLIGRTVSDGAPVAAVADAWAAYLAVLVASGAVGYRYAVRRFDGLTLDAL